MNSIKSIINKSANEIKLVTEKFGKALSQDHGEQKEIISSYRTLIEMVNEMKSSFLDFSILIGNRIVDPAKSLFEQNQKRNSRFVDSLKDTLKDLVASKRLLSESMTTFHTLSFNSSKQEKKMNQLIEEFSLKKITEVELSKETKKTSELKVFSEESRVAYIQNLQATNLIWNKLFVDFVPFVNNISNCENRKKDLLVTSIEFFNNVKQNLLKERHVLKNIEKDWSYRVKELSKINSFNLFNKIQSFIVTNIHYELNKKPEEKFIPANTVDVHGLVTRNQFKRFAERNRRIYRCGKSGRSDFRRKKGDQSHHI